MSSDAFATRSIGGRKNKKKLFLDPGTPKPPVPSTQDAQIPGSIGNNNDKGDTLEIGVEFRLDLRSEDLQVIKELGAGNGGTVSKVMHTATKVVMARKVSWTERVGRGTADQGSDHSCGKEERGSEKHRS